MNPNIDLDRREVLMHLHELGYRNITTQQLDDFIKDLRSLITYDSSKKKIMQQSRNSEDTSSSTLPITSESPSPPHQPHVSRPEHRKHRTQPSLVRSASRPRPKTSESTSSCSSDSSVPPARKVLRECSKLAAQKSQDIENFLKDACVEATSKTAPKPPKTCDCMWRRIGCKCCEDNWAREQNLIKSKENLAPSRPKSSFIRTWQLTGQGRPGSAPQRCDPVALYHHYQQMWKQQRLPGESNHNELRWSVRERMLGQEPHPRPLSQASSVSSVSRRQKRL